MSSAILFDEPGPPEVLRWRSVEKLRPRSHEVVVDVAAAGVNNADLLQRRGRYPVPSWAPRPLGLECAGTISEVGADVTTWSPTDQVVTSAPTSLMVPAHSSPNGRGAQDGTG